jgi:hypothetical protein
VNVNGRHYRTLAGSTRKVRVSLLSIGKRTVVVEVAAVSASGKHYSLGFTFHTCVPSSGKGAGSGVPYLRAG